MSQAELDAKEKALTDFPAMEAVKASIATRDNLVVEAVQPGRADNPGNVKRVESLLSESQFNYLFPLRAPSTPIVACCRRRPGSRPCAAITATAAMLTPSAARLWRPCSLTSLKRPAAMKTGARKPSGVRRWSTCARWDGMRPCAAVTTPSAARMCGRVSSGRAAPSIMASSRATLAAAPSNSLTTTTTAPSPRRCSALCAPCSTAPIWWPTHS